MATVIERLVIQGCSPMGTSALPTTRCRTGCHIRFTTTTTISTTTTATTTTPTAAIPASATSRGDEHYRDVTSATRPRAGTAVAPLPVDQLTISGHRLSAAPSAPASALGRHQAPNAADDACSKDGVNSPVTRKVAYLTRLRQSHPGNSGGGGVVSNDGSSRQEACWDMTHSGSKESFLIEGRTVVGGSATVSIHGAVSPCHRAAKMRYAVHELGHDLHLQNRSDESETSDSASSDAPDRHDASQARPDKKSAPQRSAKPGFHSAMPSSDSAKPGVDSAKTGVDSTKRGVDSGKPGIDSTKSGVDSSKPGNGSLRSLLQLPTLTARSSEPAPGSRRERCKNRVHAADSAATCSDSDELLSMAEDLLLMRMKPLEYASQTIVTARPLSKANELKACLSVAGQPTPTLTWQQGFDNQRWASPKQKPASPCKLDWSSDGALLYKQHQMSVSNAPNNKVTSARYSFSSVSSYLNFNKVKAASESPTHHNPAIAFNGVTIYATGRDADDNSHDPPAPSATVRSLKRTSLRYRDGSPITNDLGEFFTIKTPKFVSKSKSPIRSDIRTGRSRSGYSSGQSAHAHAPSEQTTIPVPDICGRSAHAHAWREAAVDEKGKPPMKVHGEAVVSSLGTCVDSSADSAMKSVTAASDKKVTAVVSVPSADTGTDSSGCDTAADLNVLVTQ